MNYRMIKHTLAWLMMFEAGFMLVPLITAAIYRERAIISFALTMFICAATSILLLLVYKPKSTALYAREGFVIVALSWIFLSAFGAIPFVLSGSIPSYIDALFETVSGFTTTGASILAEVETLPRSILMWRSFTHWIGGMGVLVFIMAFLPLSGAKNMHIMRAESPGPSVSKLVPRVRTTALILYTIYIVLTLTQFVLLLLGGMSVFEAINTSFATAGTGGFGFKNDSMASFSPYIQVTITVFMLLFSLNFSSYYLAFKGRLKDAFNAEVRTFILIVIVAIVAVTLNIYGTFKSLGETVRHAAFTVASIISTTGFTTADFDLWPEFSKGIFLLLMWIGACAGSTGGGIKVSRILILFKGTRRQIKMLLHPRQVKKITMDSRPVDHELVSSVNSYMIFYLIVFFSSVLIISLENYDFMTSFSAVSATINNIGPGLSLVGPTCNFSFFSIPSKLVLIFNMLAGRLELFPMLLLFTPSTWKNK